MNADLERRLALAQTPQTRARIRRWALLKRVCFVLAILGACVFVLVLVGFLLVASHSNEMTSKEAPSFSSQRTSHPERGCRASRRPC
ncbi:hypothetical protein [Streptomyces anulatus]|uniref:hypothetical protein n=1 Tax=Streptomyces anulatus TaxID=1892 RepID=UPI00225BBB91|nr:hypothetical protein [Streptomyces anulatus]MCX4502001.1 hypothetical protein [Streptomyces anulatus]